jgi:predicted HTH transcriptional regulator
MTFTFPRSSIALKSVAKNDKLNQLNMEELKGYDFIRINQKTTRKEYETKFGFEKKKAERHLTHMTELGLIERKGAGPGTFYELIAT